MSYVLNVLVGSRDYSRYRMIRARSGCGGWSEVMACISICCGVRGVRRERREGGRGECNKLVEWYLFVRDWLSCPLPPRQESENCHASQLQRSNLTSHHDFTGNCSVNINIIRTTWHSTWLLRSSSLHLCHLCLQSIAVNQIILWLRRLVGLFNDDAENDAETLVVSVYTIHYTVWCSV